MGNILMKIEQLRIGDEVLYPANGRFKYLKLLSQPAISKKPDWRGNKKYKNVKCSTRRDQETQTFHWNGGSREYTTKMYKCVSPEEHNIEMYVNFNGKEVFLLKRENE